MNAVRYLADRGSEGACTCMRWACAPHTLSREEKEGAFRRREEIREPQCREAWERAGNREGSRDRVAGEEEIPDDGAEQGGPMGTMKRAGREEGITREPRESERWAARRKLIVEAKIQIDEGRLPAGIRDTGHGWRLHRKAEAGVPAQALPEACIAPGAPDYARRPRGARGCARRVCRPRVKPASVRRQRPDRYSRNHRNRRFILPILGTTVYHHRRIDTDPTGDRNHPRHDDRFRSARSADCAGVRQR